MVEGIGLVMGIQLPRLCIYVEANNELVLRRFNAVLRPRLNKSRWGLHCAVEYILLLNDQTILLNTSKLLQSELFSPCGPIWSQAQE